MGLSALGSELVVAEFYGGGSSDVVSHAFVYVWDTRTSDWVLRGAPLVGAAVTQSFGISVAMSGDGDVVAVGSRDPSDNLVEGIISVYEWVSGNSQYENIGWSQPSRSSPG